jgi:hypothetical protein
MTRDAYVVSKLDDIRVGHLPVKRLSGFFDEKRRDARQSWGIGEVLSRLSRPCEENTQIG